MNKEIKLNGEKINILSATGYDDGYYWDENAKIEYKGEVYSVIHAGSGSGFNLCYDAVIKDENFERLFGEEQASYDLNGNEEDFLENIIPSFLENFINSKASKSWEEEELDSLHYVTKIDGVEKIGGAL